MIEHQTLSAILKQHFSQPIPQEYFTAKKQSYRSQNIPHAPKRNPGLSEKQQKLAIVNALRYFPQKYHEQLGKQFYNELKQYGHIYMYRFKPTYRIKAYPFNVYPTKIQSARCIMHNIWNNLDPQVAQFPQQLITYGGNGSVFSNWGQFHLTMHYLSIMSQQQTLTLVSGHPQGLYPSQQKSPRIIITNGLMVPNYSTKQLYQKLYAMGNTIYGQMTAGSFCYIGSQGIVHGTTLTLQNASRKYLNKQNMTSVVYVTSGLGGMSGAQPKAADICGCISVTAEIVQTALDKRLKQGWVKEKITNINDVIKRVKQAKINKQVVSIAYLGNIVDLWERLAQEEENIVQLGSDQTSLHNPYGGGYYPVGLTVQQSNHLIATNKQLFKQKVHQSLRRQVTAINKLTSKGMKFWDYGNSFLYQSSLAKADIQSNDGIHKFKYPSYVQDIMGGIFELGFGPFRWICTSGNDEDLRKTDKIAESVISQLYNKAPQNMALQYKDNLKWIQKAQQNKLVVGSKARILYADAIARALLLNKFSQNIQNGQISGPIILSRDHHDVSGADSPYRQTSSVYDGSMYCADMSTQNFIGDAIRGATWVALHNGGGCGWGEVINGGFGIVLTGKKNQREKLKNFMLWDVANGVSRRGWAGGQNANFYSQYLMEKNQGLKITMPNKVTNEDMDKIFMQ